MDRFLYNFLFLIDFNIDPVETLNPDSTLRSHQVTLSWPNFKSFQAPSTQISIENFTGCTYKYFDLLFDSDQFVNTPNPGGI